MPRYYFNIRLSNGELVRDETGVEFPETEAALEKAKEIARKLLEVEFRDTVVKPH